LRLLPLQPVASPQASQPENDSVLSHSITSDVITCGFAERNVRYRLDELDGALGLYEDASAHDNKRPELDDIADARKQVKREVSLALYGDPRAL
jgi:hypothetical protein